MDWIYCYIRIKTHCILWLLIFLAEFSSIQSTLAQPAVLSFSPTTATKRDTVLINGFSLSGVSNVTFGGKPAASFSIISDMLIKAVVGDGASGVVKATNWSGGRGVDGFVFITPHPEINSFTPSVGLSGAIVTLKGAYFTGASAVKFGNTPANSFVVVCDSIITAIAGDSASGYISVSTPYGSYTCESSAYLVKPPLKILSFSPSTIGRDSTVSIRGLSLSNTTVVSFGSTPAVSFKIISDSLITAVVGLGSSGLIRVGSKLLGNDSIAGFTFVPYIPEIISFSPDSAAAYDLSRKVMISGRKFKGVTSVKFGDVPASSFLINSDSSILAHVGAGASGAVKVSNPEGTASMNGFTYVPYTTILSASPTKGGSGYVITIRGKSLTGLTKITFGGVPAASFTVVSDSIATAVLGAGATGAVHIWGVFGSDSTGTGRTYFTYVPSPKITSFTPSDGYVGMVITVRGSHFTDATQVNLGGSPAASFTVQSDSIIQATVGIRGDLGNISVTTPYGADSIKGFSYLKTLKIVSFTPVATQMDSTVNIRGVGFSHTIAVSFGGYAAASFHEISDSLITAVVGKCVSGNIKVTSLSGIDSLAGFTFLLSHPVISSCSPASGLDGTTVTLHGYYFTDASFVSFGGQSASSFKVINDSTITALPAVGSSGNIVVKTPYGQYLYTAGYTRIPPAHMTSFLPTSATVGSTITIKGISLTGTTSVSFGEYPAISFNVVSDSLITAVVNKYGSGKVKIAGSLGADSLGGFTLSRTSPVITSFSPSSGVDGTTLTFYGYYFTGVDYLGFGPFNPNYYGSFKVINDSTLTTVPSGPNYDYIYIGNDQGLTFKWLTYTWKPKTHITSFAPAVRIKGDVVTIKGLGFSDVSAVSFGSTPADSFKIISDTIITAVVGAGNSGSVKVTGLSGTDSLGGFTFLLAYPPPVISSFTPASAETGITVNIKGINLTGVTAISFGVNAASSFKVISDTLITAVVGIGASGNVSVTSQYGTGVLGGFVFVTYPPVIYSFTPTTGVDATTVTIKGLHFIRATAVTFGNKAANSFTIVNDSTITAIAGSGTTGNVTVTTSNGSYTLNGVIYIERPPTKITSFSPVSGGTGTVVTIKGTSFSGTTNVWFGWSAVSSFTIVSDTILTAIVGAGSSGTVAVNGSCGGDSTYNKFTFVHLPPVIYSFTPTSGLAGNGITIKGTCFTGATKVTVGGVADAWFSVVNDSTITAAAGALGKVTVTTPYGLYTLDGPGYTVFPPTHINSFSPVTGSTGTTISIKGVSFTGATAVWIGQYPSASFTVVSDTLITAVVGAGKITTYTQLISVENPTLLGDTLRGFIYISPMIHLTSFAPTSASSGATITIHGTNLTDTRSVSFGDVPASSFAIVNDSTLTAVVSNGATGIIKVTNASSSDTSKTRFTYVVAIAPTVKSFTPDRGTTGTSVSITGTHFTGTSSVTFGGIVASSYTVVNDSTITAIVGTGSTGIIKVTNAVSSDTSKTGFTYVAPVGPTVKSFTPVSGTTGTRVTISGSHFTGTSLVTFGGAIASSFTVSSDSTITAIVGNGSTGVIKVTNVANSDTSKTRFTYVAVVAPVINSFTPANGTTGTSVIISGSHFTGTTSVKFGGIAASSFTVSNDSTITAIVGTGATGFIEVVNSSLGDTSLTGFTYIPKSTPAINIASSLSSFKTCSGISSTQNFAVSGSKLTSNVIITASNNLEISTNLNNNYGSNLNISSVTDTLYNTTIYVRVKASSMAGIYNDTVLIASSGANPKYIYVRDTINALPITPVIAGNGPLNFCSGAGVLLTDSVSSGNQWFINDSVINGANSSTYRATVSGNYTVKTTNASGCISATSKVTTVKVNPNPAANFTIPSSCSGRAVYFIDSTTLSDGTLNLSVYNWSFGDGATSDLKNPIHTYSSSASYTAKLIVTSVNGCKDSVTRQVIINPQPRASFTVSNIACSNIPVSFSDSGSANGSVIKNWKWSFGDSVSNTNNTSQNTAHAYSYPGTYPVTLSVTSDKGCTDSTVKSIVINATPAVPVVSQSLTYCQGVTAEVLKAALLNGDSLWWYNQATGGNGSTVAPIPATSSIGKTNYYVSQKNNTTSCESQRATISVIVNAYPTTPTVTSSGNRLISSASTYYKWYYYDSLLTNYTSDTINLLAKGLYKVSTSVDNICWSDSKEYLAQSNPVGTIQKDYQLTVYPNPASSQFYIDIKLDAEYSGNMKFSLVNLSGTTSYVYQKYIFNSRRIKIPVKYNLGSQVYVLTVTINGYQVKTIKITGM